MPERVAVGEAKFERRGETMLASQSGTLATKAIIYDDSISVNEL